MIGIVIVAHDNISSTMVAAVQKIIPDCDNIVPVGINSDQASEINLNKVSEAINEVDKGSGVILLTDMFGGTPSNLCLSFLEKGKIEIISGFNLPMLIKLCNSRKEIKLDELAKFIKGYGQKNIVIASDVLEGKVEYK